MLEEELEKKPCFFNGAFIPLEEAEINIRTHALHYGTGCIGGIRAYWNPQKRNLFLFRIEDHIRRLIYSSRILMMQIPYSLEELIEITLEVIRRGKWKENIYIRPIIYKSAKELSPRLHDVEDGFALYVIPLGDYLDTKRGLRACISSWVRIYDNQIPNRAKATGSYLNSALAKSEAMLRGYDEAILLDIHGYVSEGSAENLFLVKEGKLYTPDISSSILEGITRKTVFQLAKDLGIPVVERKISRSELYTAEEAFFTGTGVQIAWISEIDERPIGDGKIGPITKKLQDLFFRIVLGEEEKYFSWLLPVY